MGLNNLCSVDASESFWDWNRTWYNPNPNLTLCFQNTVLIWLPCLYLWVCSPLYILYLQSNDQGYIRMNHLNKAKTGTGFLLWIICWADVFYSFWERTQVSGAPVYLISPTVLGITMLLATLLTQYERMKGVQSSGVMLNFWLIAVLCATVTFRSKIIQALDEPSTVCVWRYTTFYIYYALLLISLLLSCLSDQSPLFSNAVKDTNPCPETGASFLSRISFWWITGLMVIGYKRPLEEKDLWCLNTEDRSHMVVPQLVRCWIKECQKIKRPKEKMVYSSNQTSQDERKVDQHEAESEILITTIPIKTSEPSLFWALCLTFGPYFLISSLYKIIQDILMFVGPEILR